MPLATDLSSLRVCPSLFQVTSDGTVYVGHQDMSVKKYLPMDTATCSATARSQQQQQGANGLHVVDSVPVSPRISGSSNAAAALQVGAFVANAMSLASKAAHLTACVLCL
jgi:hypothetical protein